MNKSDVCQVIDADNSEASLVNRLPGGPIDVS